jgi:hypothetical protein
MQTGKRMAQVMEANTPKAGRIKTGLKPFAHDFYGHQAAGCGNTYSSLPAPRTATHAQSFYYPDPQPHLIGSVGTCQNTTDFSMMVDGAYFSSHYL